MDQLLAGADAKTAFEKDRLLAALKKALAERALNAEMDRHLDSGAPDGGCNGCNGYGVKTGLSDTATFEIAVPRDRLAPFDPQMIAKDHRPFPKRLRGRPLSCG